MSKQEYEQKIKAGNKEYTIYSLPQAEAKGLEGTSKLPFALKILLENQLRHLDGEVVTEADLTAFQDWLKDKKSCHEIAYHPARVLIRLHIKADPHQ